MAPEPEILKRKRSRPSDWWAAAPTTPQQHDEPPAKKRGGPANAHADGKGMKDAPAAGNRGKSAKGKEVVRDGENGEEDELQEKPVRRGRSSGGREELWGGEGGSRAAKRAEENKGKGAQEATEEQSAPKKRGRAAAAQADEQVQETMAEKSAAKRKKRPSGGRVEEPVEAAKSSKQSKSVRRGRSSNTGAEVRAGTESAAQRDIAKKRKVRPAAEKEVEIEAEEPDEDPIAPQKRRQPAKRAEAEAPIDELVDDESSGQKKKKKKRRSGAEILEAEALALTTTEDYAKGRRPPPIHTPGAVAPFTDDHHRGRKRTRHPDANIQDVQPATSSTGDYQERGRARTRRSNIEPEEADMAKRPKKSNGSRQRGQHVEAEAASSKLQRSGPEKGAKAAVETRTKPARGSTAAEQPQKAKKRTRSSIEEVVERSAPEPSNAHKQGSKAQTQEEKQPRKWKNLEQHPAIESVKRRRIQKPPQHDHDTPEPEEAPMYQHLQAVTRRVSRQTIESKWEPLPSNCVERISQLLYDLQRPVVVRYNDERKKMQSSTALQMISRRLVSKISKGLPFPQGTRNHREDDFDLEKILDHTRALESQLTPALHANELLEAQVSKEMALLESERERLGMLEANAKTEAALRSEAARRLHSLLQPQPGTKEIKGLKDDIGLSIGQGDRPLDIKIQNDEHLQALVKELHGHVDSIQGNIRQVRGVSQAISKSKATVQLTLFDHLDSVQYEEVVLGSG